MKKCIVIIICLCCIINNISCKTTSIFKSDEISEFSMLGKALKEIDFTYGKKYDSDSSQLKLFKIIYNPYQTKEFYFSIKEFSLINSRIKAVEKNENEIFMKFKILPSGWCKGIVYMFEEDEYLRNRAEVFIQLDENLYYFEGKS